MRVGQGQKKFIVIGIALLANSLNLPQGYGDEVGGSLNIAQAIAEAELNSPIIQKSAAAAQEASWGETESLSGFLPSVNIAAQHFFSYKYVYTTVPFALNPAAAPTLVSFPNIYAATQSTLNISVPIFDGLQNIHQYAGARLMSNAAKSDHDWTKFQVDQDIRLRFFQAIAAQKLEEVSEQNLKTISDHLDQIQTLRRGGAATNYDVLRVEVQYNESQSALLQAQNNASLARQQLAVSMGKDDDSRKLEGDLAIPDPNPIRDAANTHTDERADIMALTHRAEAFDHMDTAKAAYLVPRISIGGQYMLYNNLTDSITDSYQSAYNVGIFLNWNLFDGMTSIARSKEAKFQRIQAEKSLDQARLKIPYSFNFWKKSYLYNSAVYKAKKSNVEKSIESVRLAREGYRQGVRTSTDVLDAELDLFRARADIVNSQISCQEARINLELVLGRQI
jgi:outer membrane protein TolC